MIFQGIEIFTNTWMLKSSPLLWGPVSASWFLSDLHFFAQRLAHFVSSNEQFCMHGQFHLLPLILAMVSAVSQGWKWYFNHGTSWYFSHFNVFSSYFNVFESVCVICHAHRHFDILHESLLKPTKNNKNNTQLAYTKRCFFNYCIGFISKMNTKVFGKKIN